MLLVSVWRASIMSYLLPARYFHPRRSSGLTLLEFVSLCFTVGNKNADSCLLWCSLHSVMRSPVLWVACKMTAVFNFNIKVCARSPQIFSDSCVCSRIMWHCAMERALQGGNSWNNTFRNAQMFWKRGNLDEQTNQTRFSLTWTDEQINTAHDRMRVHPSKCTSPHVSLVISVCMLL